MIQIADDTIVDTPIVSVPDGLTKGLTASELNDPNQIKVVIADTSAPLIILFGPPSCGKTLVLLRMIRYLESQGYYVAPELTFLPSSHYLKMCDELKTMAYSNYTPVGTEGILFMLLKVLDRSGNPICQILKVPGECYFNPKAPQASFPTYVNTIINSSNRKVWAMMVEHDWGYDQEERYMYAQKICAMQKYMSNKDKVVFLFNKIDKYRTPYKEDGNRNLYLEKIKLQYPNIFSEYENRGLKKLLCGKYQFRTVFFSSGIFNFTKDNRTVWTPSPDWYCGNLWKTILKSLE